MKIGDKVLILDTASREDYVGSLGWTRSMDHLIGTKGYVGLIRAGAAYVTLHPVHPGDDPRNYDGWSWWLRDLRVIGPDKWRRRRCE